MEEKEEEFTGSNDDHHHAHIIIKGKRTKRQRPSSPISVAVVTTSSSSSGGAGGGDNCSIPSPIASGYETHESTTEEEEDMANCLILLAQGCGGAGRRNQGCGKGSEKPNTRKITDKAVAGSYGVYKCNTCNRSFPSFQALGGHRASHKRPKMAMAEEKKPLVSLPLEYHDQFDKIITISPNSTTLFLLHGTNHNKSASSKVHECSICGSEFSSGQALGGHMRRHRSLATSTNDHQTHEEAEKRRNILPILDLNLPAPDDDDDRETKFQFTASNQLSSLVFSNSPALVDCHY